MTTLPFAMLGYDCCRSAEHPAYLLDMSCEKIGCHMGKMCIYN
jgi:hypothetical protein